MKTIVFHSCLLISLLQFFEANSSACLRSSMFGLSFLVPPTSFNGPHQLNPAQLNSSTIVYPLDWSFSLRSEWNLGAFSVFADVEKINASLLICCGSFSASSNQEGELAVRLLYAFLDLCLNKQCV